MGLAPTIDIFSVAQDLRATRDMDREWGPFVGPAGVFWDAGMDGLAENDPRIEAARKELWARLIS